MSPLDISKRILLGCPKEGDPPLESDNANGCEFPDPDTELRADIMCENFWQACKATEVNFDDPNAPTTTSTVVPSLRWVSKETALQCPRISALIREFVMDPAWIDERGLTAEDYKFGCKFTIFGEIPIPEPEDPHVTCAADWQICYSMEDGSRIIPELSELSEPAPEGFPVGATAVGVPAAPTVEEFVSNNTAITKCPKIKHLVATGHLQPDWFPPRLYRTDYIQGCIEFSESCAERDREIEKVTAGSNQGITGGEVLPHSGPGPIDQCYAIWDTCWESVGMSFVEEQPVGAASDPVHNNAFPPPVQAAPVAITEPKAVPAVVVPAAAVPAGEAASVEGGQAPGTPTLVPTAAEVAKSLSEATEAGEAQADGLKAEAQADGLNAAATATNPEATAVAAPATALAMWRKAAMKMKSKKQFLSNSSNKKRIFNKAMDRRQFFLHHKTKKHEIAQRKVMAKRSQWRKWKRKSTTKQGPIPAAEQLKQAAEAKSDVKENVEFYEKDANLELHPEIDPSLPMHVVQDFPGCQAMRNNMLPADLVKKPEFSEGPGVVEKARQVANTVANKAAEMVGAGQSGKGTGKKQGKGGKRAPNSWTLPRSKFILSCAERIHYEWDLQHIAAMMSVGDLESGRLSVTLPTEEKLDAECSTCHTACHEESAPCHEKVDYQLPECQTCQDCHSGCEDFFGSDDMNCHAKCHSRAEHGCQICENTHEKCAPHVCMMKCDVQKCGGQVFPVAMDACSTCMRSCDQDTECNYACYDVCGHEKLMEPVAGIPVPKVGGFETNSDIAHPGGNSGIPLIPTLSGAPHLKPVTPAEMAENANIPEEVPVSSVPVEETAEVTKAGASEAAVAKEDTADVTTAQVAEAVAPTIETPSAAAEQAAVGESVPVETPIDTAEAPTAAENIPAPITEESVKAEQAAKAQS